MSITASNCIAYADIRSLRFEQTSTRLVMVCSTNQAASTPTLLFSKFTPPPVSHSTKLLSVIKQLPDELDLLLNNPNLTGKPARAKDADNGYIPLKTLAGCLQQAKDKGWNGGAMTWEVCRYKFTPRAVADSI